eukprot:Pgem_evm1s9668
MKLTNFAHHSRVPMVGFEEYITVVTLEHLDTVFSHFDELVAKLATLNGFKPQLVKKRTPLQKVMCDYVQWIDGQYNVKHMCEIRDEVNLQLYGPVRKKVSIRGLAFGLVFGFRILH